ncbi:peptide MFS transporter [Parablastomonas sp. CN1-191]|uniref:peptide MFS transporter n=1 Tax=Parablastomonas sp. CN1-191 TaxID=3400908 RepID=UPI003BF8C368
MPDAAAPKELFGHPRGLTVLATTELWERFSFYGMQALLMLYMTKYLLLPQHAAKVLGLAGFRHGIERVAGPLSDLAFAAQTYGLYSGFIYLTPLVGAWLGDRVLGRTRTVTIGCVLMAAGHLAMAFEPLFLLALTLLVLGSGCLLGNMMAQVGVLYAPEDERRTRAFGIYLITLNIGALIAPLIIGTLGEEVSWHLGFGAAGVGMLIALATYVAGRRYLPPDTLVRGQARVKRAPLTRAEWKRVGVILLLLFFPYMLYSTVTNQSYSVMYVWADTHVDRNVLGFEVPVTWIGIIDGLATIGGVWLGNRLSVWLSRRRGRDLGDVTKFSIGMVGIVASWLFAAAISGPLVTPVIAWIAFYIIQDFSYGAFMEPQAGSIVSRDSPQSVNSIMMALLKSAAAVGYFLAGWMARFYEPLGPRGFWLLNAAVAAVAAIAMIAGHKAWVRGLGRAEAAMET